MKKFSSITRVNSRRISQTRRRARIVLVALVCLGALFLAPKLLSSVAALAAAPINITKTWLAESGKSFPLYFRNRSDLIKQIHDLQSQLAAASGDRYTVQSLLEENKQLRSLLHDHRESRIVAGIVGRPGSLPYDTLMLDRGAADGITVDAPVYIGDNTVIGVVQNVTAHTALVELVTTPGFKSTVYVVGPNIYTDAVGQGGGQLRVGVPQGLPVHTGDVVVLPSVSSGVFGTVNSIQTAPEQPEQYAFVSPKTSLASIRFVAVGTTPMKGVTFKEAETILKSIKHDVFQVPLKQEVVVDPHASSTPTSTPTTSSSSVSSHG